VYRGVNDPACAGDTYKRASERGRGMIVLHIFLVVYVCMYRYFIKKRSDGYMKSGIF
jgi:hypothetical protein